MKKLGVILIILLVLITISGCSKKEEDKKTIPTYNADIVCSSNIEDEHDGDVENYISNVFIKLDDNKNVTETIYQSISESTLLDKATLELTNQFLEIYKDIKGITASSDVIDNKLIITIKYNYIDMELKNTKMKLGTIVEDDSILKKATQLPFSYEEFKKYELNGYECK
jgi:uncharacterized lipoprotein YehR (DUF1307 family)